MINVLISGCNGRMGIVVSKLLQNSTDIQVVCGVDPRESDNDFPCYTTFSDVREQVDVIIDFSYHTAIRDLLIFAVEKQIPAVIATTGFDDEELQLIQAAAKKIPLFRSANMSIGINLICQLAKNAARFLPDFDIEIIEKHHNQKVDSPSGTALMIADEIVSALPEESEYIFGRSGICGKRAKNEIGIHAVRGGTIVGEHEVIFAGHQEVVTISHSAGSREILANGAICAAKFLVSQTSGLYSMKDLFLND